MKSSKWIYIGAIGFLASVGLSIFYFYHSRQIFGSSLSILYFILLFPLAISSAVFLFKVLNSYASFSGKYLGNELKLGGPVVIFCLVFVGGFYFYQHPPSPGQYTFSISFMDSTDLPKILRGNANISYGNDVNRLYPIDRGSIVIKDAIPGNEIMINPDIPGYMTKKSNLYKVPFPPEPLQIFMYEDTFALNNIRNLQGQISTALNKYVTDAKDFRDLLIGDSSLFISDLDAAVKALNATITRYGESYKLLFSLKDSLIRANNKFFIVDTTTLHNAFEDFEFVHENLFKDFDLSVSPLLTKYYNDKNPKTRKEIVEIIGGDIRETHVKLNELDKYAKEIQNSLNL